MSNAPLPSWVDARKLAARQAEIRAEFSVSSLPRVLDLLANDTGTVGVELRFFTDDAGVRRLDGHIRARVQVVCQRCLEPMPLALDVNFALGMVWSEQDAKRLSAALEPLIVDEEGLDPADIVSEELILAMPFVSYHPEGQCSPRSEYLPRDAQQGAPALESPAQDTQRDNPFSVLEKLKRDK